MDEPYGVPHTDDRPDGLQQSVFHLMRRALQAHSARWQQDVAELTKPQYAMLTALRERPRIDQVTLCALAATDKGTATEMLRRMQTRGLVDRVRSDTDQRRRLVSLTAAGRELIDGVAARVRPLNDEFLAPLGHAEQEQLRALLARLVAGPEPGTPRPR
ncbi:MarR family winged helix-turn-helix transcriptional regulator [Pseudonocardia sp. KRD291]|uniref:MarR family winged helix-turn-helix transcriptional regulator n=1 Tax=Pseudonocardia sp. KRD291 TaxID=2792007 RepID=UPI001C4A2DCB|nr:MarR family winged helix-turn-helix transcriptional regulator [Pseudonocardia sp. KRD291]MBW0103027.1 winged helix-turn-helix transcriptional regulator [Pseudonocardia sp. KRD291]